ncbi:MAG: hypothetical protein ROO76_15055 [Terriglobia bacterium]|nr:hypothetical protein [Terriglobia bacterium]
MEQETPRPIPSDDVDRPQHLDYSFDLVARVRAARDAAQREMEAFGDVSEYEIRKIYGQRTDIKYDEVDKKEEAPTSPPHKDRESVADEHNAPDVPSGDPRQHTFDFKAEDAQPRREEE